MRQYRKLYLFLFPVSLHTNPQEHDTVDSKFEI
jgi:hypothetical protein